MNRELAQRVRGEVVERLSARMRTGESADGVAMGAVTRQVIAEVLQGDARERLEAGKPLLSREEQDAVVKAVGDSLLGLGGFQAYLDDPQVENINANGCDVVWVRYADGTQQQVSAVASSDEDLVDLVRSAARRFGVCERRFDRASPRLSVQLPDGSRMFAVMAVTRRPSVCIRRHRFPTLSLASLVELGTIDTCQRHFFEALVRARKSLIIGGESGIGKTTMARALASAIPPGERLVTIEDSFELGLDFDPELHPDVVAMEAREANVEREGELSVAELVRWALRMSPDRIIVGEVRGEEVIPMLNAMSTGATGSMCTIHANSSRGIFSKLATYAIQAPERLDVEATNLLVANAVDFVVYLDRDSEGRRIVSSVREVVDADGRIVVSNEVFARGPDGRAVPSAPLRTETMNALVGVGFEPALLERSMSRGLWE